MSNPEEKPRRKRGPMMHLTKKEICGEFGQMHEKWLRSEQLRKEAEKAAAKVPKLEKELKESKDEKAKLCKEFEKEKRDKEEIYKIWVKTFTNECNEKMEAEKKAAENVIKMLQTVCQNFAKKLNTKPVTRSISIQTEVTGGDIARKDTSAQTTSSTVTPSPTPTTSGESGSRTTFLEQALALRSDEVFTDTVNVDFFIPTLLETIDRSLAVSLKQLPLESQRPLFCKTLFLAIQKTHGSSIPPQNFVWNELIQSWVTFIKSNQ